MDIKKITYTVENSKEGVPALAVYDNDGKKIYLHSRFYPSKEADLLRDKFNPDKYDCLVVLGAALGYHLISLKEMHTRYQKIIVIDILKDIKTEIAKIPLTQFLSSAANIDFLSGMSVAELESLLPDFIDMEKIRGIQVVEHNTSLRIFPEYYQNVKKTIERIINRQGGNLATKNIFGLRYIKNILRNLPVFFNQHPVSDFSDQFTDFPCVIVSSGPSLENFLDILSRIQNRMFIIAVDSALPVLSNSGITADFVVSIDPQPYIFEHFIHGKIYGAVPVYSIASYCLPVRNYPGLVSLNSHPIAQFIEELYPCAIGSMDSGTGTVTGDALGLARLLGFKHIALTGSDFSFPYLKIYSRGTSYQKRYSIYFNNRFFPVETRNYNYIMKSSRAFQYKGRKSRKSFIQYKESLESFIKTANIPGIYSINDIGIPLNSVKNIDPGIFIQNFCNNTINKKSHISSILKSSKCINEIASIDEVKNYLNSDELQSRIIKASLGNKIDEKLYKKAKMEFARFLQEVQ